MGILAIVDLTRTALLGKDMYLDFQSSSLYLIISIKKPKEFAQAARGWMGIPNNYLGRKPPGSLKNLKSDHSQVGIFRKAHPRFGGAS